MTAPALIAWNAFRAEIVEGMFARRRLLVVMMFEPILAALCLYTALTASAAWRRDVAVGQLVALVLINVLWWRRPVRGATTIRWAFSLTLLATTGGATSPLLPILVVLAVSQPSITGRRGSLMLLVASIVAVWLFVALGARGPAECVAAACSSALLLGGHQIGMWIRETSDEMLRASLQARDQALCTQRERLCELTRLQEAVANELKNPLTSIKGLAGLAELDPSRASERLAVLQKEVCRMQLILEDHLSFARPLTPLVAERIDVSAVIVWVVWLHDALARDKQVRFDLSHAERHEILGDAGKLRQMLMHLVIHAIEASPRGGVVEVAARRDCDRVRIAVLDRGEAVGPSFMTRDDGSELGLTIVRALARQHGGTLVMRHRDGGGRAAELELPIDGDTIARSPTRPSRSAGGRLN
jgi:signal transduction histidine kinase